MSDTWFQKCMDARSELGQAQSELSSVETDLVRGGEVCNDLADQVETFLVYGDNRDEVVQALRNVRAWLKNADRV